MELKPRILSVMVVILFLTLMITVGLKQDSDFKVQESSPTQTNNGVMAWLNAFADKDYNRCDVMLQDRSDGFYSAGMIVMNNDINYYNVTLSNLVDCISAIQVKSVVKDTDTGITDYTVSVVLTPYVALGDLKYDINALDKAKKSYESNKITDAEFQNELSQVYYEIFCNSCFQISDETLQRDLILSEKEVNGVTYVYNTVSFVDTLLSDSNLKRNLSIYENDVRDKVFDIIKAD